MTPQDHINRLATLLAEVAAERDLFREQAVALRLENERMGQERDDLNSILRKTTCDKSGRFVEKMNRDGEHRIISVSWSYHFGAEVVASGTAVNGRDARRDCANLMDMYKGAAIMFEKFLTGQGGVKEVECGP